MKQWRSLYIVDNSFADLSISFFCKWDCINYDRVNYPKTYLFHGGTVQFALPKINYASSIIRFHSYTDHYLIPTTWIFSIISFVFFRLLNQAYTHINTIAKIITLFHHTHVASSDNGNQKTI